MKGVKALITAAGLGTRFGALTRRTNKALLKVEGKPLILHIVEKLWAQGVRDIVVVTGYQSEQVRRALPSPRGGRVRTVFNPFYPVSGILGSFWAARPALDGRPFLFTTSDHFFHPSVLAACLGGKGEVRIVVQKKRAYTKEDAKVIMSGRKVVRISKAVPAGEADGEFGGMTFFSPRASALFYRELEARLGQGALKGYMMEILEILARRHGLGIRPAPCGESARIEVDSVHDLVAARRLAQGFKKRT